MTTEPPKRRRWFQFRLRTLLIVVLVLSLPLSWLAMRMERARRQRRAVEAISSLRGQASCDWQNYPRYGAEPTWLRRILGDDFFDPVTWAVLNRDTITDADLEHLKGLPSLEILSLPDTRVSDAGLEYVSGLSQLEYLDLRNTDVTPEGIRKLQEALPNCKIEY